MKYYKKKNNKLLFYIIIVIILVTFCISFYLFKTKFSFMQKIISYPYLTFNNIINNKKIIKENKELYYKLLENNIINNKNNTLKDEINILKNTLELKNIYTNYNIINCTVINKNNQNIINQITIDKGKDYNIKENMAVVTSDGLIGKVLLVYDKTSIVKLINNKDKISIKIYDGNKYNYGIITDYKDKYLIVTELTEANDIKIGNKVYTSGYGIYPDGLFISYVSDIVNDSLGLSKIIYVKADYFNDIKYVSVLGNKIYD